MVLFIYNADCVNKEKASFLLCFVNKENLKFHFVHCIVYNESVSQYKVRLLSAILFSRLNHLQILVHLQGLFVQDYGHRVRLATHSNFREFVLTAGLEFFPLGGDPKVLAGCMYLEMPLLLSYWALFPPQYLCFSLLE